MYYEIVSVTTKVDKKGNDKKVAEKFIVKDCIFFAECEVKGLELYNNENDIVAIKQSKLREFVNERTNEDEQIYFATIEDVFIDDDDNEKTISYIVAVFARSLEEATNRTKEYMKQGYDMVLSKIVRTKFVDVI